MDVAELRAIYTATSADFDRVTDHVQKRLKDTQGIASGAKAASSTANAASRETSAQLGMLRTVEQGRQQFVKSQVESAEKAAIGTIASVKAVDEVEKQSANVRLGFLKTVEAGRQEFVGSQIKAAEAEAKGIVGAVQKEAGERQRIASEINQAFKAREAEQLAIQARTLKQAEEAWAGSQRTRLASTKAAEKEGERLLAASNHARISAAKEAELAAAKVTQALQSGTTKFDPAAFWARQGKAATDAATTVETETKRAANATTAAWTGAAVAEERIHARRAVSATRATSTVIRDAKTGAVITQAELARLLSGGAKAVEAEAAKVGKATGGVFANLQKLFLQNNFLFRQLGQRAAGDLGFAAVGVGKLALNFQQLTGQTGAAAAGLQAVTGGATAALAALGPVGVAAGAAAVTLLAMAAASIGAGAGLLFIAKSVSDTEEHFDDLSRQTGLSTDNLQALDIVTRQSGSTLDKLTNSVGQLQRKLIDASEGGTSRLSVGLKKLGVDLDDPNIALNQLIDLLAKLPAGTVRTGAAMQIFGRGGRDVAGVVDQIVENVGSADGALDRLKKQFAEAGIRIDKDGVQNAAKFHDELIKIEAQADSVKRVLGEEALPVVLEAATKFSNWIARNRVEVADWARTVEHAAEKVAGLAGWLVEVAKFGTIPIRFAVSGLEKLEKLREWIGGGGSAEKPPETTFARRTFTQDRQAQQAAEDAAKKIRSAFAPRGGGGRGGGKGEDPAETARRLAEISLQETLKGLQAEHDALQRQLDLNLASRNQYTQAAVNLEVERRQKTIDGLRRELAEAENIRKPGQRAIKVAEINARIRDEERRSAKEVQQIADDSAAEQLRIGQSTAQSQLRIIETQADQVKARIREQADFRMITEQRAAEFEGAQVLRVFNARERLLRQELTEAGVSAEKRAEAQGRLVELEAERRVFLEGSSRAIAAAIRSDAEHVIQFATQIRDAFQRAASVRLEANEANLEPLRNSILTRHQLWDAELKFEIAREKQRHEAVVGELEDEAALARVRIKNEQELAATLAGIRAQTEAEEALHQARLQQMTTQAAEQRRQELLRVADDLASIASNIFDVIGKSSDEFWASLKQSAANFAKQLRDELFRGFLEKLITGQAQGAEGLIGTIINPLLGARGPNAGVADNTKATQANTDAVNALTRSMGGVPAISGGLSGVMQLIPGLFGGGRATGGPVDAGRVYQIHDNEFFRPNLSGKIYNLDQMGHLAGGNRQPTEVRTIFALGDDVIDEALESHRVTPAGRYADVKRARWNRKTMRLQFV